jgi:hypothetical protein
VKEVPIADLDALAEGRRMFALALCAAALRTHAASMRERK